MNTAKLSIVIAVVVILTASAVNAAWVGNVDDAVFPATTVAYTAGAAIPAGNIYITSLDVCSPIT